MLTGIEGLDDLALTTNGMLLARQAAGLRAAGLRRVTVSLDTLHAQRMRELARSDRHADVLAGLDAARDAGFAPIKLNMVVMRGVNADEVPTMLAFARARGLEVRFIEYMDVGGATRWRPGDVVSREEILRDIAAHYGPVTPLAGADPAAPAERFVLGDGTTFGVIASTTAPFCRACDRGRITADGRFYGCLYAADGLDLREPLRGGATDAALARLLTECWRARSDRGAEERLAIARRGALVDPERLRADPHLEMHTRGG
jgi:cyclic pyranopterin phosphate synthase